MNKEEDLKKQITFIQRMLDILRKVLRLQTQLEKLKMEKKVRDICKFEGLAQPLEDILVATIWCESGMNPKAINRNPNGTIDYGICQFNNYWYGNVISPEDALNNPEKAVRIMCRQFKKGQAKDWICYRNKLYMKYLKVG